MSLNPGVVVAHDVLMVQARQQRHLALDPAEVLAGRVDGDALHRVAAAVQLVLHLQCRKTRAQVLPVAQNLPQTGIHSATKENLGFSVKTNRYGVGLLS